MISNVYCMNNSIVESLMRYKKKVKFNAYDLVVYY